MRLFFLAAAALLTTAPLPNRPKTPRPVIIIVHGRGHVDADSAALRRVWQRDLDSALTSVGLPKLASGDVRLAWYADVLDPDFESSCVVPDSETDSLGLVTFARDFLGSLVSTLPRNESREVRGLLGDLLYVLDASRHCAAERRIGNAIETAASENRPVIVVAYSLGSLVTYGYLHARASDSRPLPDLHLITIGSPLGNREVRELLGQGGDSLRVPPNVRAWENVYDPHDGFAAPLEGSAPRAVRDRITESAVSDGDPHHIGRYLRDRATGAAIGRALCASARTELGDACRRL
ncbi:MAG: hypothetical protein WD825_13860 [Gemmatimonadaceae bacterium]